MQASPGLSHVTSPVSEWSLIGEILPATAASAEAYHDDAEAALFREERALVARAVETRRRSFATTRACARRALAELGIPPAPILRGRGGAPRWPSGVVGSMTHCAGYRGCAVASSRDLITLGIDAEPNEALRPGSLRRIAGAEEMSRLRTLAAAEPGVSWDRLLFSAKESVYKAWFPLTGRWLAFEDATVTFDQAERTFGARLTARGPVMTGSPLSEFTGRWLARDGLVITAIAMAAGTARD
jgi:4'-phosphopantetheinyl transferase EntD